ncbi:hypothetical protein [Paludibaculum fermentans]|uniref:hypothetical protein n=1 Tax=Paludibaculum fermentans TaxID=1473598 RepID=UPI003EC0804D
MPDTDLQLWDFADAPDALRELIPTPYAGGTVVIVLPGGAAEIVDYLMARWTLLGLAVVRYEREDGSIVLAGPELPLSPAPVV